jgi:uncharacterized protein (TIGR03437 family)
LTNENFGCAKGGTIHFKGENGRTLAKPVPVGLKGECPNGGAESEQELEEDENLLESKVKYLLGEEEITELTFEHLMQHDPVEITVCSKCELANPQFWLTPHVAQYFDVDIEEMVQEGEGEETQNQETKYLVTLTLKEGVDLNTLSNIQGTGHLKSSDPPRRTCPEPLKIRIKPSEETPEAVPAIVVGSADLKEDGVAPGEIVSVFGEGLGPGDLETFGLGPDNKLPDFLADTLVLFDGIPAPLLATSDGQVNAVVPYEVAGQSDVEMLLIYKGSVAPPFLLPVKTASPALFTMNASGNGQGAILNQNLSINSFSNPALPGSVVVLYATGFGPLEIEAENGAVVGDGLPQPKQPVQVLIGGSIAQLLYAGGAPGLVNSVTQLNVRLPFAAPSGTNVPVVLVVGGERSTGLATVAIQ